MVIGLRRVAASQIMSINQKRCGVQWERDDRGIGCCGNQAGSISGLRCVDIPPIDERQLRRIENNLLLSGQLVLDLGDDQIKMGIMGDVIEVIGGNY